ncbi:hypothetical protein [Proteus terrae]|uniref:hypothetical protein n=1 Tax=Proteus terrae TaxID=1574161 RepID=UPI001BA674F1|nr:hypothetical protein [Proteus terrae]
MQNHPDLYVAVSTRSNDRELDNKHVTLCYMKAEETKKLYINDIFPEKEVGEVVDVVYWERVNLTVAIVKCEQIVTANKFLDDAGFKYGYEFIPHVTICTGDESFNLKRLIGMYLILEKPYVRLRA